MTKIERLLEYAESKGHEVIYDDLPEVKSISIKDGVCFIGVDLHLTVAEENVCLAHELGHCETGGFYCRYSPCEVREKYENRANNWAIKKLVPKDELIAAIKRGYVEKWELAEEFGVTEEFVVKAVSYYKNAQ